MDRWTDKENVASRPNGILSDFLLKEGGLVIYDSIVEPRGY